MVWFHTGGETGSGVYPPSYTTNRPAGVLSPREVNWSRGEGDRLCGLVVRVLGYRSRGPWFDSRRYQIFWEVVGLERGPFSLVRIIEELLEWKSSGSEINGRGKSLRWPRATLYPLKLALSSPTSGGRSVGVVCLRTKATEFVCYEADCSPLCSTKVKNTWSYTSIAPCFLQGQPIGFCDKNAVNFRDNVHLLVHIWIGAIK
jgi:hypothetical protein